MLFRGLIAYSAITLVFASLAVLVTIRELSTPAILVPMGLAPCLCGVAFAIITRGPRGLRLGGLVLRAVALAITISGLAVMFAVPPLGIIELLVGMLCLAGVGAHPMTAHRAAGIAIACGAVGSIWFLATAAFPAAWPGPSLFAAGASIGLIAGGVLWLAQPVNAPLPRAVARRVAAR